MNNHVKEIAKFILNKSDEYVSVTFKDKDLSNYEEVILTFIIFDKTDNHHCFNFHIPSNLILYDIQDKINSLEISELSYLSEERDYYL